MFPTYTIANVKNFYYNVYIFLKNGIKNNKRTWPDNIENIKDINEKNYKKLEFYRKIGKLGKGYGKEKLPNEYENKKNLNIKIINYIITG